MRSQWREHLRAVCSRTISIYCIYTFKNKTWLRTLTVAVRQQKKLKKKNSMFTKKQGKKAITPAASEEHTNQRQP